MLSSQSAYKQLSNAKEKTEVGVSSSIASLKAAFLELRNCMSAREYEIIQDIKKSLSVDKLEAMTKEIKS
jgi:hypothetical protein